MTVTPVKLFDIAAATLHVDVLRNTLKQHSEHLHHQVPDCTELAADDDAENRSIASACQDDNDARQ